MAAHAKFGITLPHSLQNFATTFSQATIAKPASPNSSTDCSGTDHNDSEENSSPLTVSPSLAGKAVDTEAKGGQNSSFREGIKSKGLGMANNLNSNQRLIAGGAPAVIGLLGLLLLISGLVGSYLAPEGLSLLLAAVGAFMLSIAAVWVQSAERNHLPD